MDSRPSSLYRGMRNHPPVPEGEEMSEVQSDPSHREEQGPISRAKREGHMRQVRKGAGIQGRTLQSSLGEGSGVHSGSKGEGEGGESL